MRLRPSAFPFCGGCWTARSAHLADFKPRSGGQRIALGVMGLLSLLPLIPLQLATIVTCVVLLRRAEMGRVWPACALTLATLGLMLWLGVLF